jgi:arylsulfatase A-like enzyme
MPNDAPSPWPVTLSVAAFSAALGAVVVGAAETLWLGRLGPLAAGTWWFTAWLHGGVGALVGLGWGVVLLLGGGLFRERLTAHMQLLRSAPVAFSLSLLMFGAPVGWFRLRRDLFAEAGAPLWSMALLAALLVVVAAVWSLARWRWIRWAWVEATVLGAVLVVTAPGAFGGAGGPEARSLDARPAVGPDVILILADTLRADALGVYGARGNPTPRLDGLAADGVHFARGSAQASWTRASIATLFSGLYPGAHSAEGKADVLPADAETLAERLSAAGYATSALVNNPNVTALFGFDQGFDDFLYLAPRFFLGAPSSGAQLTLYNVLRLVRERLLPASMDVTRYYTPCEEINAAAMTVLGSGGGGGRFLFLHYMEPHDPYFSEDGSRMVARVATPHPDPAAAQDIKELYAAEVRRLDRCMGELFDALGERSLYDPAVIAFTSDHGEEFFEHGGWWHGTTLYEEQVHVPLVLKLPRGERAGSVRDDLARVIDLPSTLAVLAGADPAAAWMGRSLLEPPAPDAEQFQFAQERFEGNELRSLRSGLLKLIIANPDNPRGLEAVELYQLDRDPGEQQNLAAQPEAADSVSQLARSMTEIQDRGKASALRGDTASISVEVEELLQSLGYMNEE